MKTGFALGVFLVTFGLFPLLGHAADVPTNVALSSTDDSITVQWTGDSDSDSYNIYWGTSFDNLDQRGSVEDPTTEFTITGLASGTEYFIAVSSVENGLESDRSAVESITTDQDTTPPDTPDGFEVTDISDVTETSARFTWEENTEEDLDGYEIRYGQAPGTYTVQESVSEDSTVAAVAGLDSASRYYFTIVAIDASGNVSGSADELIVDTLPDSRPPDPPAGIRGELAGMRSLQVTIDPGNERMVDFAGNIVYYGTASREYGFSRDIGDAGEQVFTSLPGEEQTWYFTATAYDRSGNESGFTDEIVVEIEDIDSFLGDEDDFEGGCFVAALKESGSGMSAWKLLAFAAGLALVLAAGHGRLRGMLMVSLLVAAAAFPARAQTEAMEGRHTAGLSAGYYIAAESDYDDFYEDNTFLFSLFYDFRLSRYFSVEAKAGYWQDSGKLLSETGDPTGIETEIEVIPASLSVKFHLPLAEFISGYVGAGPDYWYVSESTEESGLGGDVDEWVAGYHAKTGLMLFNTEKRFEGSGAFIETGFSSVDRFGQNDIDIGGWITELGFFYRF